MGYTVSKVIEYFNDIVNTYKSMKFSEVPCSNICYCGNVYRFVDLYKKSNGCNIAHRILLQSGSIDKVDNLGYPVHYIDLIVNKYIDGIRKSSERYKRFYMIDSNYYTTHLDEVKNARKIRLKRFLDNTQRAKYCHINVNKLSYAALDYIKSKVNTKFKCTNYTIHDVYFSYRGCSRILTVVVEYDNNSKTKAIYI